MSTKVEDNFSCISFACLIISLLSSLFSSSRFWDSNILSLLFRSARDFDDASILVFSTSNSLTVSSWFDINSLYFVCQFWTAKLASSFSILFFSNFPFYWVKEQNFKKIEIDGYSLNSTTGACWNIEPTCVRDTSNLKIKVK